MKCKHKNHLFANPSYSLDPTAEVLWCPDCGAIKVVNRLIAGKWKSPKIVKDLKYHEENFWCS